MELIEFDQLVNTTMGSNGNSSVICHPVKAISSASGGYQTPPNSPFISTLRHYKYIQKNRQIDRERERERERVCVCSFAQEKCFCLRQLQARFVLSCLLYALYALISDQPFKLRSSCFHFCRRCLGAHKKPPIFVLFVFPFLSCYLPISPTTPLPRHSSEGFYLPLSLCPNINCECVPRKFRL